MASCKSSNPDLIDAKQAADMLGLSVKTIHIYQKRGTIPGRRIGNVYRFSVKELLSFVPSSVSSANGTVSEGHAGKSEGGAGSHVVHPVQP